MSNSASPHRHLCKVVVVGESRAGKSQFINRFVRNQYEAHYKPTVGSPFLTKEVVLPDGRELALQVWDTAGRPELQVNRQLALRDADLVFLCYDVGDSATFRALDGWWRDVCERSATKVVLGCKADLPHRVQSAEAQRWCLSIGVAFYECSAASDTGIAEPVMQLVSGLNLQSRSVTRPRLEVLSLNTGANSDDEAENKAEGTAVGVAWKPNSAATACEYCFKPFNVYIRKHHCRRCGGIFCSECSKAKEALPELGITDKVRVCTRCREG